MWDVSSGDTQAVALAVKLAAAGVRKMGFSGKTPHLRRVLPDGTLHLVHFQRVVSGVTGRTPGFCVNLNAVSAQFIRDRAAEGDERPAETIRSAVDVGAHERLGHLGFGYDHWWHPTNEAEAHAAADEVIALMQQRGLPWLAQPTREEPKRPDDGPILPAVD